MADEKVYQPYPMVINGIFIGMIGLRKDQIDYFNIPAATPAEEALVHYIGSIKAHKRNIHSKRLDDTAPTRVKSIERVAAIDRNRKKLVNSRGGKPITIPTELISVPAQSSTAADAPARRGNVRTTVIRFPGAASNGEISRWIKAKFVGHTPTYFKTPAGASYPVTTGTAPVTGAPPPA